MNKTKKIFFMTFALSILTFSLIAPINAKEQEVGDLKCTAQSITLADGSTAISCIHIDRGISCSPCGAIEYDQLN